MTSRFIKIIFLCSVVLLGSQGVAQTVASQPTQTGNSAVTTANAQTEATFPPGTFGGDDINLKLDNQGKYLITGGAVEKPEHGTWTIEKKGKHTLIHLISNNKKDDDWLFGVRSKNTLQSVDAGKLNVLDKPLNINEDVGILTREK
ncbi:hypothetical protein EV681_0094 [Advenella incenata]|uniref:Uncharacterized protein n=1 Tax=Advenella incenata TaxID=267800 RepID=A0A4Q7VQ71_9BURK|nr:hypothetical protein [Advenella incenata]RZT98318.1 hypothetical protein EV681_0094 [Advenella incenata]